jgi:hypothetical protein
LSGVTEITPEREVSWAFSAAVHCTIPLPAPDAPEVIVSHGWLLDAVHCRAESFVVIVMEPEPPEAGSVADGGVMVKTPPDCVSVRETAVPDDGATVTIAARDAAEGFA